SLNIIRNGLRDSLYIRERISPTDDTPPAIGSKFYRCHSDLNLYYLVTSLESQLYSVTFDSSPKTTPRVTAAWRPTWHPLPTRQPTSRACSPMVTPGQMTEPSIVA